MNNTISNISDLGKVIAKTAAAMLADKVQFVKTIDKEPAGSFGKVNGYNVGETIKINKPARFLPSSTADITSGIQGVTEETTSLSLDIRKVVPVSLTSLEIQNSLSLKDWTNRILDPAVSAIAQSVESAATLYAKNHIYNLVGTAGSTVYNTTTMLSAGVKLSQNLAPEDGEWKALLDPLAMASATDARKGLFQASAALAEQYKKGYIGSADGFDYLRNNLLPRHTNGADVAYAVEADVVTIANGMSTLGLDGVTSGATIKAGTVFTIASCYAVHPITKATLPHLQQFVATADVTETSSNQVIVAISPSIYYTTTDPRQNVSTAPVDEDTVTTVGSASTAYTQQLVYHPSAFRFVSVPLMQPSGAHLCEQATVDGMTLRVWMDSNILTDNMVMRIDFLGGVAAVRPEWACRITS